MLDLLAWRLGVKLLLLLMLLRLRLSSSSILPFDPLTPSRNYSLCPCDLRRRSSIFNCADQNEGSYRDREELQTKQNYSQKCQKYQNDLRFCTCCRKRDRGVSVICSTSGCYF
ncbi:hypothetical protein AtNW77_Chr3g0197851 [Arabidopsis thaliana]